jgi:hypothetical protein
MPTGIELIAQERQEQIEKHGHTVEADVKSNPGNELLSAIMLIVGNVTFMRGGSPLPRDAFYDLKPESWSEESCFKIITGGDVDQLKKLGALAAAEIDRLQSLQA